MKKQKQPTITNRKKYLKRNLGLQTKVVHKMAAIVPLGILRDGSLRSPDLFEPAMMPVTDGK